MTVLVLVSWIFFLKLAYCLYKSGISLSFPEFGGC